MFSLTINEKGGQPRSENFDKSEITIGRVQGNDVILPKGNISKRHSRIVVKDGKFIIVDLKSTNGTYVNGKKITAPQVVKSTDKIYIGDFTIQVSAAANGGVAAEPRDSSAPKKSSKEDEIDLFGGDAPSPEPAAAKGGGGGGAGSPGLIDDNFDQEFDAAESPKPAKGGKKGAPAPKPAPEPKKEELDLEEDFNLGGAGGASGELELDVPSPPEPDEPSADLEAEADLDEPKAPLVPMKGGLGGGAKKSTPAPAPLPSRAAAASKVRPGPGPKSKVDLKPEHDSLNEPEPDFGAGGDALAPMTVPPSQQQAAVMHGTVGAVSAVTPMSRAEVLRHLHRVAVEDAGLRGIEPADLAGARSKAREAALAEAQRLKSAGRLDGSETPSTLSELIGRLATDLSPLTELLGDDEVVEIVVAHDRSVLADRKGMLEPTSDRIDSEQRVIELINALGMLGGVQPSVEHPLIDVRLRDGARVVGALPPLAFRGPTLAYRKTTRDFLTLQRLKDDYNSISEGMLTFIDYCVRFRKNLLVSLGAGVNASGTLNALLAQMPVEDRIVTVENGVELHLGEHKNVVALEPSGAVGPVHLVHYALGLQADRIVLGHLGGEGTADLLRLLAGPLEGSVAAYPAASPLQAIERLAKIELRSMFDGAPEDAKRLIAAAFPVVLQEQKFSDNSRRIVSVSEVLVEESGEVRVEDIFRFKAEGVDENLLVTGSFAATGHTPRFLEELVDRGEAEIDMEIFKA